VNPALQLQTLVAMQVPRPLQTAGEFAGMPKQVIFGVIAIWQLMPVNPGLQTQVSGRGQPPCPEQTFGSKLILPKQTAISQRSPARPQSHEQRLVATQVPELEQTPGLPAGMPKQICAEAESSRSNTATRTANRLKEKIERFIVL
jgi:hypothetical protein